MLSDNVKFKRFPRSRGQRFCDEIWEVLVKSRDGGSCVICGSTNLVNAHHLISRRIFTYRWEVDNGLTLCPNHHKYDPWCSAHTAPWAIEDWVSENRPGQHMTWIGNREDKKESEPADYDKLYYELEKQHNALRGSYYKPDRCMPYKAAMQYDKIKGMLLSKEALSTIVAATGLTPTVLKQFITKNVELRRILKGNSQKKGK